MNRGATAVIFVILGAALASVVWWTLRDRPGRIGTETDRSDTLDASLREIGRRIDALDSVVRQHLGPTTAAPEKARSADPSLAEIQARLAAIEAVLAKPERSADSGLARLKPPEPKAKDTDLIVELLAKGQKEPGVNAMHYWGWSPREIHQALGRPDSTRLEPTKGYQDWFYVLPDGKSVVQVRFEAGFVIGVWP